MGLVLPTVCKSTHRDFDQFTGLPLNKVWVSRPYFKMLIIDLMDDCAGL